MPTWTPSSSRRLRGVFHLWALWASLAAGIVLVVLADGALETVSSWVYAAALVAMFGASALYHRFPWRSAARRVWARRLDHSMIFIFIAGSYTPFALLCFEGTTQWLVLALVWASAVLGLVLELVWIDSPRWLKAVAYLAGRLGRRARGAAALPGRRGRRGGARDRRRRALHAGSARVRAEVAEPAARASLGFHEVFHLLVVAAAVTQFVAVSLVVM